MKLTIYLALVLGFVASCNCSGEEFEQVCLEESNAWKAFEEFVGDEINRGKLFESYFGLREKRFIKQRHLQETECPKQLNGSPVVVFDIEQAHTQLCIREKSLEAYSRVSNDGFVRKKIKKMVSSYRDFRNRLQHRAACAETEVNFAEVKELLVKHKEHFYESCKVEETYNYVTHKIMRAIKDYQVDLTPLNEAKTKLKNASQFREEFCIGSTSDCCGDDIVDEARSIAIIEIAELLLKMAKGLVEPFKNQFNQERTVDDWDDKFKKICLIERRTSASMGKQYYRGAQEQTLKALNLVAQRDRTKLGKALGQQSCPATDKDELPPVEGTTPTPKVVIGDRCEEENKPKLMCQSLTEAETNGNRYHRQSLSDMQSFWCKKEEKVLTSKDSVRKIYKPPVCSEQVVAAITLNAKIETEILLELLELEKASERSNELSKKIADGTRGEIKVLRHLKKVLRTDITDNLDAATRKESLKALMLISDELEKLETDEEVKKFKLSSFLAPSWPTWLRL